MSYRNYSNTDTDVSNTYKLMYINQTLDYVKKMHNSSSELAVQYNIEDLIKKMDEIIDESDPDTDLPQSVHAYQTGESIYNNYFIDKKLKQINIRDLFSNDEWNNLPQNIQLLYQEQKYINKLYDKITDWEWLPLVGFIHDLGKILLLPEFGNFPQWSVVGDIFPVGCEFSNSNILYEKKYHECSDDYGKFDKYGIYNKNCGLESLYMSYSHDYYLYNILKKNIVLIPDEGLYIIRFHSFYAWHTPKNNIQGYINFANNYDWYMLPLLKLFQKSDLYSKSTTIPAQYHTKYLQLLQKYNCTTLFI